MTINKTKYIPLSRVHSFEIERIPAHQILEGYEGYTEDWVTLEDAFEGVLQEMGIYGYAGRILDRINQLNQED